MAIEHILLGLSPGVIEDSATGHTFCEGRIEKIDDDGLYYTVPSWDDAQYLFGPSPYTGQTVIDGGNAFGHVDLSSLVGFRCLVMIPNNSSEGVVEPWIIGMWPSE
jgi:hypothetical protein